LGGDRLAQRQPAHTLAERDHSTRHFGAWRERRFGLELILAAADQDVGEIAANRTDRHTHLSGTGHGIGELHPFECLGLTPLRHTHRVHALAIAAHPAPIGKNRQPGTGVEARCFRRDFKLLPAHA
jgi:hypothetical protein